MLIKTIIAVFSSIAAMSVARGIDCLVSTAERILRPDLKYVTSHAPLVT